MKLAVAQINSALGDFEKNVKHHIKFCNEAIKNKCDLILFPELSLTGYSLKDINFDIAINPYKSDRLDELKKKSNEISIICGFVEEDENFGLYNSSAFISEGKVFFTHKKIYPPTYGIFEEFRYFSKGKVCKAFDSKFGRNGILICEDLWHITLPYVMAMDGAKIIFGLAASPTRLATDTDKFNNYVINSEHHKTFARLLSLYFIFCNRVGFEDGVNFWGGSEIIDPFGNVIVSGKLFEEDLLISDIDLNEIRRARHLARHFLDENIDITLSNLKNIGGKNISS